MSTQYPDPMPTRLKTWNIWLNGVNGSLTVQGFSIAYERHHVVFKTYQGITFKAYRSDDVRRIELVP